MSRKVISIIMGGGRGTRLHPLTKVRCKPAVPLAGKYRLVDIPISNCLNSGLNKIFLLTQFNTASLHRHIQESYKFDPYGGGFVDILSAEQTERGEAWYQGTADAVRQNLHHLDSHSENDLFLILSGDQLYSIDFAKVIAQHCETGADVTIAAKAMKTSEVEGLGLMRVDDESMITEFVEKPKDPKIIAGLKIGETLKAGLSDAGEDDDYVLANMGIYVFSRKMMFDALANPSETDFGKEVIPGLLGKAKLGAYIFEGYWEDIGTVRAFFDANLSLADPQPPFNFYERGRTIYTHARFLPASKVNGCQLRHAIVADGCIIEDANLNRCSIGVRSVIGGGTQLKNTVMMGADFFEDDEDRTSNKSTSTPNVGIGANCIMQDAIIDKNARIGDNVKLSPVGVPDMWESTDGSIIVRDGVLVVLKDATVPSGTVVGKLD